MEILNVAWGRYYVKGKVDASKVMSVDKVRMNVSHMNHILDTKGVKN